MRAHGRTQRITPTACEANFRALGIEAALFCVLERPAAYVGDAEAAACRIRGKSPSRLGDNRERSWRTRSGAQGRRSGPTATPLTSPKRSSALRPPRGDNRQLVDQLPAGGCITYPTGIYATS